MVGNIKNSIVKLIVVACLKKRTGASNYCLFLMKFIKRTKLVRERENEYGKFIRIEDLEVRLMSFGRSSRIYLMGSD